MSYDLDLLHACKDKSVYLRFKDVIKKHNVGTLTHEVFDVISTYWDNYPSHTTVDWETMRTFFFIVKGRKMKNIGEYETLFTNVKAHTPTHLTNTLLQKLIELDYATRIYNETLGISVSTPGKSITNIRSFLDEYDREVGITAKHEDVFVSPSLEYVSRVVSGKGLNWRLKELQLALGPLRKGDFIILAARPETGKTTCVASEATFMLGQLEPDEYIIWINNEEASAKVMMRAIQAHHQVISSELLKDTAKYEASWVAAGGDRFLILDDDSPIKSASKLDALFERYKPGLIIFDQLDKVEGFQNDREDLRIGKLYEWARRLAKRYCPIIAVSQVDGTGEGEKWLHMNQLRGSKTDKVGEADAIITIGKSNEPGMDLDRFINIPKNKLFGGAGSDELFRHGMFEVSIEPAKARYVSKIK